MTVPDSALETHLDPEMFREAVNYTAAETGFSSRLIEKDYFCTLILRRLAEVDGLVFRGGTCLAKVHESFYRLSEDLDFVIPTALDATRAQRRQSIKETKLAVASITKRLPVLRVYTALTGARGSTQYNGTVLYASLLSEEQETIRIEVSLREPLLLPSIQGDARTLLLSPVSGAPQVPILKVSCLSRLEALAEKFRAALTRREVAVRDYYDIDHAVRRLDGAKLEPGMIALIRAKLAMVPEDPIDTSQNRLAALRLQLEPQLKAVLRDQDFAEFDLDRAIAAVGAVAADCKVTTGV